MPQYVEKINLVTTRVAIPPESQELFVDWQSKLNDLIANFPGFLSLEILAPDDSAGGTWTFVQRFTDASSAAAWNAAPRRQQLFEELRSIAKNRAVEDVTGGERLLSGVTEVLITRVAAEQEEGFRKWLAKIHQAEAKFPGFRGMYVQSPNDGCGIHWITFLRFNSAENLDRWLASSDRAEILKELDPMITALESHRVISPYAGWFGSIAKVGEIPSVWKETMLVLLVLFPIIMLEFKFLSPFTHGLNISLATFIGNAISVSLIAWPGMPLAIWFFAWWLSPRGDRTKINLAGTLLLLIVYLIEILILWSFV